jgi:predicted RNase H-like HicB family nuclease/predicted RNA binding protein YcfA (HicA-like mRNA interferase family)
MAGLDGGGDEVPELRNIRPKEAIAALERAGGQVRAGGKGSHVNIEMPNGQIVTFSGTREPIKIGLLRAMLRKAGITDAEFVRLLALGRRALMDYTLVIHRADEGGYWAEVPALAGCFVQGETVEDLLEDAPAAIDAHIGALREDGQAVPEASPVIIATVRARGVSAA